MARSSERIFDLAEFAAQVGHPKRRPTKSLSEAFQVAVDGLRKRHIPFLLHGAWAMGAYGYRRATEDLDFLLPYKKKHVKDVYELMDALGAIPGEPGPRDPATAIAQDKRHLPFNLYGWVLDFFRDTDFEAVRARSKRKRVGPKVVNVISPKDLIARKRERGTLQDLADVERLERFLQD